MVVGDISVAMMYEQISSAMFALPDTKEEFISVLSLGYYPNGKVDECLQEGMDTKIGLDIHYRSVSFQELLESIFEDYAELKALKGNGVPPAALLDNLYAKFGFYNIHLWGLAKGVKAENPCKHEIGLRELAQLWYGLTKEEINTLIKKTFLHGGEREVKEYESTGSLQVRAYQSPGVKLVPQQKLLIQALRMKNVQVYIVTAAPTYIIQQLAHHYDVDVDVDNVHGEGLNFVHGKCSGVDVTHATYDIGKANKLKTLKPGDLLCAAGDSMGDYDMLQAVTHSEGIKLIVNTIPKDPKMIQLYTEACNARKSFPGNSDDISGSRVLIQGFDAKKLKWIPSAYSNYGKGLQYTKNEDCHEYFSDSNHIQPDLVALNPVHVDNTPVEESNHKSVCGHGGCSQIHHVSNIYGKDECESSEHGHSPCKHGNVVHVATGLQVHAEFNPTDAPANLQETGSMRSPSL
uniref:Uncharacterized protein AlNc14C554G12143 n=1 Tax=Albugo laibachii Nc14 TaxID=890382 RepID=F0X150_9STRA|nr:conserved hypothetical protein [Albugo laibachii Nc14]|eukprot:CCA27505.1 conserved hypothetical protein [Albugo laibachii Nc14]